MKYRSSPENKMSPWRNRKIHKSAEFRWGGYVFEEWRPWCGIASWHLGSRFWRDVTCLRCLRLRDRARKATRRPVRRSRIAQDGTSDRAGQIARA